MTQNAIGYARTMFDDPSKTPSAIAQQEQVVRDYAAQHGFTVTAFYSDHGDTGATMERPGLQATLAAICSGEAAVLITESIDRLSRDQQHLHKMLEFLAACDVMLHTVVGGKIGA